MAHKPIGPRDHAQNTDNTASAGFNLGGESSLLGEVSALREMLALLRQQARETDDPATLLRLAGTIARLTDAIGRALTIHNKLTPDEPAAASSPARTAPRQATQPTEQRPTLLGTSRPSSLAALLDEVDRLVGPMPRDEDAAQPEPPVPPGAPIPTPAPPHRPAQPKRPSRSQRSRRGRR